MSRTYPYKIVTEQTVHITDGGLYTMLQTRLNNPFFSDYKVEDEQLFSKERVDHDGYDWVEVPNDTVHPNTYQSLVLKNQILNSFEQWMDINS